MGPSGDTPGERPHLDTNGVGPLAQARGEVSGYEIHMGRSRLTGDADRPFRNDGAAVGNVLGTYLHGLLENRIARQSFLDPTFAPAGLDCPDATGARASPADTTAHLLVAHMECSFLPEG